MKNTFLFFTLAVILASCSTTKETEKTTSNQSNSKTERDALQIRISNSTDFAFENIVVKTSDENIAFGDVGANEKSAYKTFQKAYRYAYVEFEVADKPYTFQPVENANAIPLKNGKYTYEVDIDKEAVRNPVSVTLIED